MRRKKPPRHVIRSSTSIRYKFAEFITHGVTISPSWLLGMKTRSSLYVMAAKFAELLKCSCLRFMWLQLSRELTNMP